MMKMTALIALIKYQQAETMMYLFKGSGFSVQVVGVRLEVTGFRYKA
jgi:hypothetical protein